jgi:hypothetical protein
MKIHFYLFIFCCLFVYGTKLKWHTDVKEAISVKLLNRYHYFTQAFIVMVSVCKRSATGTTEFTKWATE